MRLGNVVNCVERSRMCSLWQLFFIQFLESVCVLERNKIHIPPHIDILHASFPHRLLSFVLKILLEVESSRKATTYLGVDICSKQGVLKRSVELWKYAHLLLLTNGSQIRLILWAIKWYSVLTTLNLYKLKLE